MNLASQHKVAYKKIVEEDGIRILLLQPRMPSSDSAKCDDRHLHCRLIHTTISHCETDLIDQYTALSYVWGDVSKQRLIKVHGMSVKVTANLFAALCNLQDETRVLPLWVDALCINQNDNQEKSRQVAMMGRIYSTAYRTVIYLGALTPATTAFLEYVKIKQLANQTISDDCKGQAGLKEATANDLRVLGARNVLRRPWFTRAWTFQELVLSRSPWIQLGKVRLSWDAVYDCLVQPDYKEYQSPHQKGILMSMQQARQEHQRSLVLDKVAKKKGPPNLVYIVVQRQGLGASDARDMIFAYLSFAKAPGVEFRADYGASCAELYTDFACYLNETIVPRQLLRLVSNTPLPERMESLPSWVPDWTKVAGPDLLQIFRRHDFPRSSQEKYFTVRDSAVLALPGEERDIVVKVSEAQLSANVLPPIQQKQFQNGFKRIRHLLERSWHWENISRQGEFRSRAQQLWDPWLTEVSNLWCGILGDMPLAGPKHYAQNQSYIKEPWKRYGLFDLLTSCFDPASDLASSFVEGKRIALMASGNCQIVPLGTHVGDLHVFSECKYTDPSAGYHHATWILRPRKASGSDCLVDTKIIEKLEHFIDSPSSKNYYFAIAARCRGYILSRAIRHCSFIGEATSFWDRIPDSSEQLETTDLNDVFALH